MVPARTLILGTSLLLALAASGCGDRPVVEKPVVDAHALAEFTREQQAWRDARAAELTAPDGWTSLVGLHWITPGAHYVGRARDNGIRLSVGPVQFGMIDLRKDGIRFVPHSGVPIMLDDAPLRGPAMLRSDAEPEGASRLLFDEGKGVATVIRRGDRHALRVRHADAATRTGFAGIAHWPGGPDWVVDGRFTPHPPGRTLPVANIVGTVEQVPNPGTVLFERDGREHRLEALQGDDGGLFLVFADLTSGHGSYGPGRYLDTAAPATGRVRLDFNRAYNPPCAFTPFATCPLPPDDNRLDLAVAAGEKIYTGTH